MDPILDSLRQFTDPVLSQLTEKASPLIKEGLKHLEEINNMKTQMSMEYLGFEMPKYRQDGWVPSKVPYTEFLLIFTLVIVFWEFYLELRQHSRLLIKEIPETLVEAVDNLDKEIEEVGKKDDKDNSEENSKEKMGPKIRDNFEKARLYNYDKSSFELFNQIISTIETFATLIFGFMPYLWDCANMIADKYNLLGENVERNEIIVSLIFLGLQVIIDDVIHMPISLYSIFVIEARHGFNKQSLALYFTDKIKGLILGSVIGAPLVAVVITIVKWGGEYFYIYLWSFMFVFTLFMTTIYPVVIAPMFNKYEPLDENHADLKKKIDVLADSVKFPLTKIYTVDGSKRSNHSNAYFYGFFKNKRIVLFDTLLKQVTDSELVAILGHELGHWKMGHTIQMLVIGQVHMFISFFVYGFVLSQKDLYLAFGFSETPTLIGLFLFFSTIWAPIEKFLGFMLTLLTRHNEFEADAFAHKLGRGKPLQSGLVKLQIENKSNMNPDPLFSAYHYSHPPLVERLAAIKALDKKRV